MIKLCGCFFAFPEFGVCLIYSPQFVVWYAPWYAPFMHRAPCELKLNE